MEILRLSQKHALACPMQSRWSLRPCRIGPHRACGLSRLVAAALGLLIGGAIGNAVDRAIHGAVVDFVSLHAFGWRWYVFNVADSAIVAGVVGLLYDAVFGGATKRPPSTG